jgi:hypothetical protein
MRGGERVGKDPHRIVLRLVLNSKRKLLLPVCAQSIGLQFKRYRNLRAEDLVGSLSHHY